ncbi:Hypothetical protein PHPALM_11527 [Phytophthora palmivora]|uniref:Uncharacterized protein n=1 Tax=Phytophthora palmivora TaxID=4796 RepID=A0A2P4Y224_9STRA|nr:Hypothetical protein PHPALM_11527 [Phytophthora palmivora]
MQRRKGPSDDLEENGLRRKIDGVLTESAKVERMYIPMPNVVRKYIPEELQLEPMYKVLTTEQG